MCASSFCQRLFCRSVACRAWLCVVLSLGLSQPWSNSPAFGDDGSKTVTSLRELDATVLTGDRATLSRMVSNDVQARLKEADRRENAAWRELGSRGDWEAYRDPRLARLRKSLGRPADVPLDLRVRTTRTLTGDRFRIDNILFESRPGLVVTANLYRPAADGERGSRPGILIFHSHHAPKTQSELQDMGILWARQGAVVLVMDQLGHGERRQHPFKTAADFAGQFRVSRQDYYFRYNSNLQLSVIGESLMGWMVWDMQRGVDLLLSRPDVDPKRIVLFGAVAGGGDPAAVTGALDTRIAAVVPFNFGGPQPETRFPLPDDAEEWFRYAGSGSWESTRNLRLSASGGFLPWLIVGATAPRRLVYAHEFAWDRERDPVWKRLEKIFAWYDVPDHLAFTLGRGAVTGQPPESTHCTNIGPEHRRRIHDAFAKWFELPRPPDDNSQRFSSDDLMCWTADAVRKSPPRPLHELALEHGLVLGETTRHRLTDLPAADRLRELRRLWAKQLGDVEPRAARVAWHDRSTDTRAIGLGTVSAVPEFEGVRVTGKTPLPSDCLTLTHQTCSSSVSVAENVTIAKFSLAVERDIVVPAVLLLPPRNENQRLPCVVAVSQAGKQAFLRERTDDIAALLNGGTAVCLCDLRGCGETRLSDGDASRTSGRTSVSASEWMLDGTLIGARLRDLRTLLRHLRSRSDLDAKRFAIWGDSFAPVNAPDRATAVPWDAAELPHTSEPLGGLLALLCALFEDDITATYARGGLWTYVSVLDDPFLYVPHDVIVPDAVSIGDLDEVAATLAPRPLRIVNPVDARNRRVPEPLLMETYRRVRSRYESHQAASRFQVESSDQPASAAAWLLEQLRKQ